MKDVGGVGRGVKRSGPERPKPLRKRKPPKRGIVVEEKKRGEVSEKESMREENERWTAKLKLAVVVEIGKGITAGQRWRGDSIGGCGLDGVIG